MNAEEKPKKLKSKDKDVEDCQTYAQKLKKKMDHKVLSRHYTAGHHDDHNTDGVLTRSTEYSVDKSFT